MARSRVLKVGGATLVVLLALLAFGFWWFFIRDDSPPEAALVDRETVDDAAPTDGIEGAWQVAAPSDDQFAGFRIQEQFPGFDNTAVVRTPAVEGTLTISGTTIEDASVTVDLTQLESKDAQPPGVFPIANRVRQLENDGLETSQFSTTTFELTAPIELTAVPEPGATVNVEAQGDLTLHGVTKPVTIPLEARWNGEVIDVSGSLQIALADFDITPPERDFVSVADTGTIELQLTFEQA
jgi:polyisoprenoid-binding protein YceI